jgi:putative endonuclease
MKSFELHSKVGQLGEKIAKKYLITKGYTILAENYYQSKGLRRGEIDIIAEHQKVIHFIEVKTRTATSTKPLVDSPEIAITRAKLRKIQTTAEIFLKEMNLRAREIHFDALAVTYFVALKKAEVKHFVDIYY